MSIVLTILSLILGPQGPVLTPNEVTCFDQIKPRGFILFHKKKDTNGNPVPGNILNKEQVSGLVSGLVTTVGRPKADIAMAVDAEGGIVWRFPGGAWPFPKTEFDLPPGIQRNPDPSVPPPAFYFGQLYEKDPAEAVKKCRENYRRIGEVAKSWGFNVVMAPCLDLHTMGTDGLPAQNAISSLGRSFSSNPDVVAELGLAAVRGLLDAGVVAVIKHMPGLGPTNLDSHRKCSVVDLDAKALEPHLRPFKKVWQNLTKDEKKKVWGMVGHILYPKIDPIYPSSLSKKVIDQLIRGKIGFDGVLVTDDLFMGGADVQGLDAAGRVKAALAAGVDISLYCHGTPTEYTAMAKAVQG